MNKIEQVSVVKETPKCLMYLSVRLSLNGQCRIDFCSFSILQVCGLSCRTVAEPQGSKRSDNFNSTYGAGCPFQTLHSASASAGDCVYTGNQLHDSNVALLSLVL